MTWGDNKDDRCQSKQYTAYAWLCLMEIVISSISFSLWKGNGNAGHIGQEGRRKRTILQEYHGCSK